METTVTASVYSLRRIKTFRGMDGQGLNAELLRDGNVVAFLVDEGCGGMMHFDWADRKGGVSSEEELFEAFIAAEKAKMPEGKRYASGSSERDYFNGETWVNKTVDAMLNDKKFRKLCKTHVVFQVGAKIGSEEFLSVKGLDLRSHIEQKYAGQKLRILNDEYKA